MFEFLLETIQPANLPATVMMLLVVLYWLLIIGGVLGAESLDLDLGLDADIDADVDADFDGSGGFLADALTFFHLGEIPVMIVASFFVLFFWIVTMMTNHYLNPTLGLMVTLYLVIPNLLASLLLTKVVLMPLVPLFHSMKVEEKKELVGQLAIVTTSELDGEFGQITIEQEGPPIVLNARTENGQRLSKNDPVKITAFRPETGIYIVEPEKSEMK